MQLKTGFFFHMNNPDITPLGEMSVSVLAEVKQKKAEGSSSSQLCNPECKIHHGGETCKEDSLVVVKDQKECVIC